MIWIVSIISLIALWLDGMAYRRIYRHGKHPKTVFAAALADDLLPLVTAAIMFLPPDNPHGAVMTSMWIMWVYMISVPPRMIYLIFRLWSRRRVWRIVGGIAAATTVIILIYGTVVTRTDYRVNRIVLQYDSLPEAFDGYRVAMISDLHIGAMLNPAKECRQIVDATDALDADLVVFCGDLINIRREELSPEIRSILGSFRARDGVVSVIGNHDTGAYINDRTRTPEIETARLIAEEGDMGWRVLDNETIWIRRGGDSISLSGISFMYEWQHDRHSGTIAAVDLKPVYADVDASSFNITLSHIPQIWDNIVAAGKADLTLSGHVHGAQFKLPAGRRGVSPAMILYKRWSGLYRQGGACLYINDGIGCIGIPTRIGVCPEITLFELECSKK